MAEKEYIEREAFIESQHNIYCVNCNRRKDSKGKFVYFVGDAPCRACGIMDVLDAVEDFPAADVLPRDEAIKMGAELAAMHGSDATSQQLEEAYLKGVGDGMTRRDVRPVVKATWEKVTEQPYFRKHYHVVACSACRKRGNQGWNFCPNCGAKMEDDT